MDHHGQLTAGASRSAGARRRFTWLARIGFATLVSCLVGLSLAGVASAASYSFSVLAGTLGTSGYSDVDPVLFSAPEGLAVDSKGDIFVADRGNHVIRMISPGGVVSTYAGQPGTSGHANGPRESATFSYLSALAVDSEGNLFVADNDAYGLIRRIDAATGEVTSYAAGFLETQGLAVGPDGDLYVTDMQREQVVRVDSAGTVTAIAGQYRTSGSADSTSGLSATFDEPRGIAADADGNLYVADCHSGIIRRIDHASGAVSTIAGQANTFGCQDGAGAAATFFYPSGISRDASGDLLVADQMNDCIRKLHFDGAAWQVTTAPTVGVLCWPRALAFDGAGHLLVTGDSVIFEGVWTRSAPTVTIAGADSKWHRSAVELDRDGYRRHRAHPGLARVLDRRWRDLDGRARHGEHSHAEHLGQRHHHGRRPRHRLRRADGHRQGHRQDRQGPAVRKGKEGRLPPRGKRRPAPLRGQATGRLRSGQGQGAYLPRRREGTQLPHPLRQHWPVDVSEGDERPLRPPR